jgi:tetratricopeptide (TPR) repeat protein
VGAGVGGFLLAAGAALTLFFVQQAQIADMRAFEAERKKDLAEAAKTVAEEKKAEAEEEAETARTLLVKGRRVASVLRSARIDLHAVFGELERSYYSARPLAEKRKTGEALRPRVRAFAGTVKEDSASRAAWLALEGWLNHLAGSDDEALDLFASAATTDPDVAYGRLFEAMVAASRFLGTAKRPNLIYLGNRFVVREPEKESEEARKGRERFEALLKEVSEARVWGEASAREFRDVAVGLEGLRGGDPKAAEEALTRALAMPELIWLEADLLVARTKVRHLLGAHGRMAEDLDLLQKRFPDHVQARYFRALLRREQALQIMNRRGDSLREHLETRAMFDRTVREDPDDETAILGRAVLNVQIGRIHAHRGMAFRENFEGAIRDYTELLRRSPNNAQVYRLRGFARREFGVNLKTRGEDPEALYRKALEDISLALDLDATPRERVDALATRAKTYFFLAEIDERKGRSPLDTYARGRSDCEAAARMSPRWIEPLSLMAQMYFSEALWKVARRRDGTEDFRKCLQTWSRALEIRPGHPDTLTRRGIVYAALADLRMRGKQDPTAALESARRDLLEAVKKDPKHSLTHETLGKVYVLMARFRSRRKEDGEKEVRLSLKHFNRAVGLSPGYLDIRLNRAISRVTLADILRGKEKDPREALLGAVADCDEIIRRAPKKARIHGIRAKALKDLGDAEPDREGKAREYYERAIPDGLEAVRRSPRDWSSHLCLGQAYLALGRYAEAVASMERAEKIIGGRFPPLKGYLEKARKGLEGKKD